MDVNGPQSQEDLVINWEPAHSLVEDAISGAEIARHLPALAGPPASLLLAWEGAHPQLASSPLVFIQSFVL